MLGAWPEQELTPIFEDTRDLFREVFWACIDADFTSGTQSPLEEIWVET